MYHEMPFPTLSQYGLTALTQCGSDNCPAFDNQTYTLGFHICAVGISDPSDLENAVQSDLSSCGDNHEDLFNCRAANPGDITCSDGALAVTCDMELFCSSGVISNGNGECIFEGSGITDEGQFVACPTRSRTI